MEDQLKYQNEENHQEEEGYTNRTEGKEGKQKMMQMRRSFLSYFPLFSFSPWENLNFFRFSEKENLYKWILTCKDVIIGLTGTNCSGKSEIATYLRENGFEYYSLSDIVREEAFKRKISPSRERLISLGKELRDHSGSGILAERISKKISNRNTVIDSIRSPEEVNVLKQQKEFILIGVNAPIETRFERSLARGREGDGKTVEEFKRLEEQENNEGYQQLKKTLRMSDVVIINDKTIDHLRRQIDHVLQNIQSLRVEK